MRCFSWKSFITISLVCLSHFPTGNARLLTSSEERKGESNQTRGRQLQQSNPSLNEYSTEIDINDMPVRFLVLGDWGCKKDSRNIPGRVASLMNQVSATLKPQFILNTGDNFYESGLYGGNNMKMITERWHKVFNTQPNLQKLPWFSTLGNHDYHPGANPACVRDLGTTTVEQCVKSKCCYSPAHQFTQYWPKIQGAPAWNLQPGVYMADHPARNSDILDIAIVDSLKFLPFNTPEWSAYNAAHRSPAGWATQSRTKNLRDLENLVSGSQASWKIAMSHVGIASYGPHCGQDSGVATDAECDLVKPLRNAVVKLGIPLYINGHDHNQQVVGWRDGGEDVKVVAVTSGAFCRGGNRVTAGPDLMYPLGGTTTEGGQAVGSDFGFSVVAANHTHLVVKQYTLGTVEYKDNAGRGLQHQLLCMHNDATTCRTVPLSDE